MVDDVIATMNNKLNKYTAKWQVYKTRFKRNIMQFVAKTSTPGYTLLHFHTYNLSIDTYTSNFPSSIIPLLKNFDNQFNYFCTST